MRVVFQHAKSLLIGSGRMSIAYRFRKDVNYIRHFIRQDRPGTFSGNLWSTCAKPWLWMLAQKLDSICSPFSNQFSKVDILWISKKEKLLAWKGCHNEPGDIRMNTLPLAVSIYNLNWLDWKQINPGWHTWTPITVTCLPWLQREELCYILSIFSTDEWNKCGLLPSGRYCDYEPMSDLRTADNTLRMIIYFSC